MSTPAEIETAVANAIHSVDTGATLCSIGSSIGEGDRIVHIEKAPDGGYHLSLSRAECYVSGGVIMGPTLILVAARTLPDRAEAGFCATSWLGKVDPT